MKHYNVAFLGFGNVGKALARLLRAKAADLREHYGIECTVTGVATRRMGWLADKNGFDPQALSESSGNPASVNGLAEWLSEAKPDAVFETTSLNHETGEPAISYLRAVLESGAHAITANKGAVVYGYEELSALANANKRKFFFEATVADSAPVFSLFRECLPGATLRSFSGMFSSTCSVIIESMEAGRSFAEGVKAAQDLGVTETDPSHDVDGWDSTVKVCALARVLMQKPLKPGEVNREGIRRLTTQEVQSARNEGKSYKLISRAQLKPDGTLQTSVRPEKVGFTEPLGNLRGTSLAVHFELDTMPGLTITSHRPNLQSTAYGLLSDFVNALRDDG